MMKTGLKISLILILVLGICSANVLAYSDDLFKFDLPSTYEKEESEDENRIIFVNTEDENKGMVIELREAGGLKKSVWDIDEFDLDRLIRLMTVGSEYLSTDRKAKLGKEKAIKIIEKKQAILGDEELYIERYLLASNNYIYIVSFVGETEADFNCEDYKMIKESFKLKDRTTNPTVIYVLIVMAIIGIKIYMNFRKQRKLMNQYNNQVDYGVEMEEEELK